MKVFNSPVIVLDTETTGLPHHEHARVIEVGAVLLDEDGCEQAHFETLVQPNVFNPRKAAKALSITGISAEEVFAAPPEREAYRNFRTWFDECGAPYVTAFNIAFDRKMLGKSGVYFDRWANCIMLKAKGLMGPAGALPRKGSSGDWKWPKLSEASAFFQIEEPSGRAHRALYDARVAARVACEIARRGGVQ